VWDFDSISYTGIFGGVGVMLLASILHGLSLFFIATSRDNWKRLFSDNNPGEIDESAIWDAIEGELKQSFLDSPKLQYGTIAVGIAISIIGGLLTEWWSPGVSLVNAFVCALLFMTLNIWWLFRNPDLPSKIVNVGGLVETLPMVIFGGWLASLL